MPVNQPSDWHSSGLPSVPTSVIQPGQLPGHSWQHLSTENQAWSLGLHPCYAANFIIFFFFSLWKWLTLLLSLVYCRPRRMYGKFLCIPYGNILPVYYSISSHTFYFLRPSGGELPYTVLRNLKTQLDLDVLCSNTKLIFHLIVIWFLEAIHGLCSYSLLKFGE